MSYIINHCYPMSILHIDSNYKSNESDIKLIVENAPEKSGIILAFLLEATYVVSPVSSLDHQSFTSSTWGVLVDLLLALYNLTCLLYLCFYISFLFFLVSDSS